MHSKTWLITGAASGFGRALAEAALSRGDQVALAVRRPEAVADLTGYFSETASVVPLELTDPVAVAGAPAQVVERFGRLDVLVNAAGRGLLAAIEETSDAQLQASLAVNFTAPLQLIRAALPILRAQGSGHLVNLGAIAASIVEHGFGVYGGAKAALELASEVLAGEVRPFGVKVTVVIPGPFRTTFIDRSVEFAGRQPEYAATVGKFATILERIKGRQPGDPQRAAAAILSAVDAEKPPLRLWLGGFAHDRFGRKLSALGTELEASKPLGLATDFPPGSAP